MSDTTIPAVSKATTLSTMPEQEASREVIAMLIDVTTELAVKLSLATGQRVMYRGLLQMAKWPTFATMPLAEFETMRDQNVRDCKETCRQLTPTLATVFPPSISAHIKQKIDEFLDGALNDSDWDVSWFTPPPAPAK